MMKPFPRQRSPVASATSAIDFLQRHDGAASLLPAALRLLKLRRDLLALLPAALRDLCEVAGFDDETVTVQVSSAGGAAKLRQTLPRIRDGLIDRGWKINAIRMRVQPRISSGVSTTWRAPSSTAIPLGALDAFADLNEKLAHPALKSAVERLIRRRRPG